MNLQSLPLDISYRIISYLDPIANIRTLRHLILASPRSSTINKVANDRLRKERTRLLDRLNLVLNNGDAENFGDAEALRAIAKVIIGKQLLSKSESTDEDEWVCDPRSLSVATMRFCYRQHRYKPYKPFLSASRMSDDELSQTIYSCNTDHHRLLWCPRTSSTLEKDNPERLSIETDFDLDDYWERNGTYARPDSSALVTPEGRIRQRPEARPRVGWGMVCISVQWG